MRSSDTTGAQKPFTLRSCSPKRSSSGYALSFERVRTQRYLRGLRGCAAATVILEIHSPLDVINPPINLRGDRSQGNRALPPSLFGLTHSGLKQPIGLFLGALHHWGDTDTTERDT